MKKKENSGAPVQSRLGKSRLDNAGAAIGAARINPDETYRANPMLLKEYIDNGSDNAWREIRQRTDNVYIAVSNAIEALDAEEPFSEKIVKLVGDGKILFFKPNLVNLPNIDPQTHSPKFVGTNTPWEFVAVVMRWFHDKKNISYHKMAVGDAGTEMTRAAALTSNVFGGDRVTVQALLEGKCGKNYGGWGFYFTRKYLAECHDPSHTDDPMRGYEESLVGDCVPPGKAGDRLLVYDLNKIANDYSNGRDVPVADGINFKTITLHKVIVGGDPNDAEDLRNWPGCVLVSLPKLKIHSSELLTCAVKNLGIGLYPMQANASQEPGKYIWKYAFPNWQIPAGKVGLPHTRWILKYDEETGAPVRDSGGNYVRTRTGGLEASMADMIQAVKGQGITMLHVVDAIETVNIIHVGGIPVPEGLVFASNDIVAVDVCGARYLYTMVPMAEVDKIRKEHNLTSDVIQKVPMPKIEGSNIVTREGYDSPFSRYNTLKHCEDRGLGQPKFHVVGKDLWNGDRLASLGQHLGWVHDGAFIELLTNTFYQVPSNPLRDFQATSLAYLKLNDKLTGSDFTQKTMEAWDENGDGIIDYMERGRNNATHWMAYEIGLVNQNIDQLEALKLRFLLATSQLKLLKKEWNPDGHSLFEYTLIEAALVKAFTMANSTKEMPDPLFPGMTWGKGKWPSFQFAIQQRLSAMLYGRMFPDRFDLANSPYGHVFRYADIKWNSAGHVNAQCKDPNEDIIGDYIRAVSRGADELPFIFYVPKGFSTVNTVRIPNVKETDDPKLLFTASFNGEEDWRELRLSSFHLK